MFFVSIAHMLCFYSFHISLTRERKSKWSLNLLSNFYHYSLFSIEFVGCDVKLIKKVMINCQVKTANFWLGTFFWGEGCGDFGRGWKIFCDEIRKGPKNFVHLVNFFRDDLKIFSFKQGLDTPCTSLVCSIPLNFLSVQPLLSSRTQSTSNRVSSRLRTLIKKINQGLDTSNFILLHFSPADRIIFEVSNPWK